jgi:phenylalanyl-tRNA synthetase beta subunit
MKFTIDYLKQYSQLLESELFDRLAVSIFEGEYFSPLSVEVKFPHNRKDLHSIYSIAQHIIGYDQITHPNLVGKFKFEYIGDTCFAWNTGQYSKNALEIQILNAQLHANNINTSTNLEAVAAAIFLTYQAQILILFYDNVCNIKCIDNKIFIAYDNNELLLNEYRENFKIIGGEKIGKKLICLALINEKYIDPRHTAFAIMSLNYYLGIFNNKFNTSIINDITSSELYYKQVPFSAEKFKEVIGFLPTYTEIAQACKFYGFQMIGNNIYVPKFREDLQSTEDIIEEILFRVSWLEKVDFKKPLFLPQRSVIPKNEVLTHYARKIAARGYTEIKTLSLISSISNAEAIKNSPNLKSKTPIVLSNPMSLEMSQMRLSLLPGIYSCIQYNIKRQIKGMKLFEIGKCFSQEDGEQQYLSIASYGQKNIHPYLRSNSNTFYEILSDIEMLLVPGYYLLQEYLDNLNVTAIRYQNKLLGVIGYYCYKNDKVAVKNSSEDIVFCEINLDIIKKVKESLSNRKHVIENYSIFPSIKRDISIEVDINSHFYNVRYFLEKFTKQIPDIAAHLQRVTLKDVYFKKDCKVITLQLTFTSLCRTLLDTEVNNYMHIISEYFAKISTAKL